MRILKILFGVFVIVFLLSGIFTLAMSLLGVTFGLLGAIIGFVWDFVTHPVVLVVLIAVLAYRYFSRK